MLFRSRIRCGGDVIFRSSSNARLPVKCHCVSVSSSVNFYETDLSSCHFVDCRNGRQRRRSSFRILSCLQRGEQKKRNSTRSCEPVNYVRKTNDSEQFVR